jgi:hypothetical protein
VTVIVLVTAVLKLLFAPPSLTTQLTVRLGFEPLLSGLSLVVLSKVIDLNAA